MGAQECSQSPQASAGIRAPEKASPSHQELVYLEWSCSQCGEDQDAPEGTRAFPRCSRRWLPLRQEYHLASVEGLEHDPSCE